MTREEAERRLNELFGFAQFYDLQWQVIENVLVGKSILLVDDIFDSGYTIKEIGQYLTSIGAIQIAPLVIARTVGGDI